MANICNLTYSYIRIIAMIWQNQRVEQTYLNKYSSYYSSSYSFSTKAAFILVWWFQHSSSLLQWQNTVQVIPEVLQLYLCVLHVPPPLARTFDDLHQNIGSHCNVGREHYCSWRSILNIPPMGCWIKCWRVWLQGVPPGCNLDVSPGSISDIFTHFLHPQIIPSIICWVSVLFTIANNDEGCTLFDYMFQLDCHVSE